ncbi:nucleotidyltransferase family protein, partial [Paracoccaceae bacterium]|nr:nucleotidyltransferase family protein [Paracoccaceae bacterium]
MHYQAVVLAGGFGTRLKSISGDLPKPLVNVGNRPVIGHIMKLLESNGINKILVLLHHEAEKIKTYLKDPQFKNLKIKCVIERKPRGTAGAVYDVLDLIEKNVLILYADTLMEVNLKLFMSFHKKNGAMASLFAHPNDHPYDSDLLKINKKAVIKQIIKPINQNPTDKNLASAALYCIDKEIFKHFSKKWVFSD